MYVLCDPIIQGVTKYSSELFDQLGADLGAIFREKLGAIFREHFGAIFREVLELQMGQTHHYYLPNSISTVI